MTRSKRYRLISLDRLVCFICVIGLVPALMAAIVSPLHAEMIDGIVAVVDDNIIMMSQLRARMDTLDADYKDKAAQRQVLRLMIEDMVVEKSYASMGFLAIAPERIDALTKSSGMDERDARLYLMKQGLMDMMVKSRVVVTDRMLNEYYGSHGEYSGNESLRLKQIIVMDNPQKVKQAMSALDNGEQFDKVALEVSDVLAGNKADIGWVAIENLSENTGKALEKAKPGEIIGPVKGPQCTFIFKVVDRKVRGKKAFDETRQKIMEQLQAKYQREAFNYWLNTMMSEHFIGVYL
ncbi:MAG: peptidyl-prolyl cis-trans isomerase [Thermodesulfobacteriota bacterium]|nr:peptidyl-prolyl cis-trans isomerase [Thermodesulfobacteriota bacterium]